MVGQIPVARHALLEPLLVASLHRPGELAGQRFSEVLPEVVAEETVDDWIYAGVGVCQQVEERHDYALSVYFHVLLIASVAAAVGRVELLAQL